MPHCVLLFELSKLAVQFIGALVITWLAVKWALSRYKAEKTWELRMAAYVDATTAISEMKLVTKKWFDEAILDFNPSVDYQEIQRQKYRNARQKLDESLAKALLLLPQETSRVIKDMIDQIDNEAASQSLADHLDIQWSILNEALDKVVLKGRETLGVK